MIPALVGGCFFIGFAIYAGLSKIAEAIGRAAYNGVRVSLGHVEVTQNVRIAPRAAAKGEGEG